MTDLARLIDHTLLKPEANAADIRALVVEARELDTYSVCVSPTMVPTAREAIADADADAERPGRLRIAAVAGFPSGAHFPQVKALEARQAVDDGADEIDMVIDLGRRDLGLEHFAASVYNEVTAVRDAVPHPTVLKVILETAVLTDEEIVAACRSSERAGADFVKTSTGFHPAGGATVHAVQLMRATVGDRLGVKASGGIRTREAAEAMIAAGANRLGVSSSRAILAGEAATGSY